MPIDPSIPLAARPPEAPNPLGTLGQIMQLRAMQQQGQAADLQMQEKQRAISDQDKLRAVMRSSWTTDENGVITPEPGKLAASLAAAGLGDKIPDITESLAKSNKATADAKKSNADALTATKNAVGAQMAGVRAAGYTPAAFQTAAAYVLHNQLADPKTVSEYLAAAQTGGPQAIKGITDKLIAESEKQTELGNATKTADARAQASATGAARLELDKPKIALETTRLQQETTGSVPMTAAQTAQKQIEQARLALERQKNDREQKTFDATFGTAGPGGAGPDPVAQAIAEYRLAPPAARSLSTPGGQALMKRVSAINPDFDATQFPNRNKTRQSFTTGTQGQQINAMNTAIGHLDQLGSAIGALDNSDVQAVNQAKNWLKTQLGAPAATNFDTLKVALSGELASVLKKSGATDAEIKSVESTIASKNSPAQLAGYVQTQIPILGSKLSALNYQYHQAMGEKDPFSALSPEAKGVLTKHGFDPANPQVGGGPKDAPNLSGLQPGHGRTFTEGPFKGQTWTLGVDGQPKQVKD